MSKVGEFKAEENLMVNSPIFKLKASKGILKITKEGVIIEILEN